MDENENKFGLLKKVINILLVIALCLVIGTCIYKIVKWQGAKDVIPGDNYTTNSNDMKGYLTRIEAALNKVKGTYIDDVEMEKLVQGAISGIADATGDPYTRYVSEDEYKDMVDSTRKEYCGIGVHIVYDLEQNGILVVGVMPDSPAMQAGIKPGDVILQIGEVVVSKEAYKENVDMLKGEENTTINLKVRRDNEILSKDVLRKKIIPNNVESKMLDSNIGYIKILAFETDIYKQFKTEYDKLMQSKPKGLIIDVRDNSGGLVSETIEIADLLMPKGEIVKLVYKDGSEKIYRSDEKSQINIPLSILVNSRSASASEILAGAIKDSNIGLVVGTKTYGKGIVQTVQKISVQDAISITTSKYYTSSGVEIHKNGIEPNILVELPKEFEKEIVIPVESDTQLQKAIEYIQNKQM